MNFLKKMMLVFLFVGCAPAKKQEETAAQVKARYLYVATGACYSGNGITTLTNTTASNMVYRVNLSTGVREDIIADYYSSPSSAGDSPVSITDYDDGHLLVLVENSTTASLRRIELVEKKNLGARVTYSNNITALSAQLRRMLKLSDNYLLISKSTALEKQKEGANRLTVGANLPWVSLATPASACTPSATLLTSMAQLPNGNLVFGHAGTGNSRLGVISPMGYTLAGDCKSIQAAPTATAFPTAMFYDAAVQKLIVAYGGSTTAPDMNSIYAYTVNEATGLISDPQRLYDVNLFGSTYNYLLFGVSAMAYDSVTRKMFVASAINTGTSATNFKIEKISYDASQIGVSNNNVLTPSASTFYSYGSDTKCISDMIIAN